MITVPFGHTCNAGSTAREDLLGVCAWRPPRIIPRLTSDRRLDPLVYGYRYDPEFKQCRRHGVRRHGELIEAIRAKSLRLIADRPGRGLKRAVKRFLRSPAIHFDVLHDTWLDGDGPCGHLTLAERQASFYAMWKGQQNGEELLPWPLDPSVPCFEPFYRRGKSKGDGRWRTFYAFGVARTTRQRLVCAALTAASCNQYRDQAIYRGAMSVVVSEVTRMLRDDAQRALTKTTCSMIYENTVKLWMGPDLGIPESISALMYDGKVASVTFKTNEQDYGTVKSLLVTRYGAPMKTSVSVVKTVAGGEFTSEERDWNGANVAMTVYQRHGQIDQSEVFVQYKTLMKAFLDNYNAKQSAAALKL